MPLVVRPSSHWLAALCGTLTAAAASPALGQAAPPTDVPPGVEAPAREAERATGIRGRIVDADTGEPLPGIRVTVVGGGGSTITDDAGAYELALPRGTYTLRYAGDFYQRQRVRGITVRAGGITDVNLRLAEDELEE